MNFVRYAIVIAWVMAGAGLLFGRPMAGIDLPTLCDGAEVIVVGRVVDIRTGSTFMVAAAGENYPAQEEIAQIAVDYRFKGSTDDFVDVIFVVHTGPDGYNDGPRPLEDQYRAFFLRKNEAGFEAFDPDHPFIEVMPGPAQVSGNPLDDVVAELQQIILFPQSSFTAKETALLELRDIKTNGAPDAVRSATQDPDLNVRMIAIGELLRIGDLSQLAIAEKLLQDPPPGTDQRSIGQVANGILLGVRDPSAIPTLAVLITNKNVYIRRATAYALRHTRSPSAIKPLTQALNDTDPEVLNQTVDGLAEITHTEGQWAAPGIALFRSNQESYVEHWKEWASQQPQ